MCIEDVAGWFLHNGLLFNPTQPRPKQFSLAHALSTFIRMLKTEMFNVAYDSELPTQLNDVGSRPHLSHVLSSPSQRLGQYQIILLGDRGTCV